MDCEHDIDRRLAAYMLAVGRVAEATLTRGRWLLLYVRPWYGQHRASGLTGRDVVAYVPAMPHVPALTPREGLDIRPRATGLVLAPARVEAASGGLD